MPNPLPDTITRDHIIAALAAFDGGAAHRFADSTGYDLVFEGRRYPPKAIVGIAARAVTGLIASRPRNDGTLPFRYFGRQYLPQ